MLMSTNSLCRGSISPDARFESLLPYVQRKF